MKKLIREALFERERNTPIPLVFVSFIGGSIMEVLVDKTLVDKVIVILRDLGHKWLKDKIDPLARLVRKPGATTATNSEFVNAKKCKQRAELILRKFAGPEVIAHYTDLLEKAEAIIKTEEEKIAAEAQDTNETAADTNGNDDANEDGNKEGESPPTPPPNQENDTMQLDPPATDSPPETPATTPAPRNSDSEHAEE